MIGALLWPYQCSAWGPGDRLERILQHCEIIDEYGGALDFTPNQRLILLDLEEQRAGLRIVMDQPQWFMREGQLVLSLFLKDFRAFSLAFSLHRGPEGIVEGVIGGIQGRKRDDMLDIYRDLTKSLYGQRPRDFLLEIFCMFCRYHNIERIIAVSDAYRHHRHPYFNKKKFTLEYDAIWRDRGGWKINEMFFQLDVSGARKKLSEVKSKKRAMYRKRYELLNYIEDQINANMRHLKPTCFKDG